MMLTIIYRRTDQQVMAWTSYIDCLNVVDGIISVNSPDLVLRGATLAQVSYSIFKDRTINRRYNDEGGEIPWTLAELAAELVLEPIAASDLPHSMHIAALKSVDVPNKKATVVRKWMGQNYEVPDCYVSLGALEAYQAGKIVVYNPAYPMGAAQNANSFVLVYFISENPYDTAIEIPVIVDKVVK